MYDALTQPKSPGPAVSTGDSLRSIVLRLSTYLENETANIGSGATFDFQQSSERKSRLLFEFNRASRTLSRDELDSESRSELDKLKVALKRNEAKIRAHLSAVREVSEIMVNIIRKEEADGTYGQYG